MDAVLPEVSGGFINNLGPGGKYYRYTQVIVVILALTFLTLLTLLLLPYITGSKYQNPVSRLTGILPVRNEKSTSIPPLNTANPAPTLPPYKLPTGTQTYNFGHGKDVTGPKIQTLIINPLDPAKGASQTITLSIKHDSPVTSAVVTIATDNKETPLTLKLTGGTDKDGTWSGSYTVNDTYDRRYDIKFNIKSASGSYENVMHIR